MEPALTKIINKICKRQDTLFFYIQTGDFKNILDVFYLKVAIFSHYAGKRCLFSLFMGGEIYGTH